MRSISEIYEYLATEKNTMSELDTWVQSQGGTLDNAQLLLSDISSGSRVAIWRLWLWLAAVASWIVEALFESHKTEITAIIAGKTPHTLAWYSNESKKYQDGVSMEWDGNQYYYPKTDGQEGETLVTFAAASDDGHKVTLKVAKGEAGSLSPLSDPELNRFSEWWGFWKDAGVVMDIVSLAADYLKISITIVRDRMALAADNSLIRDPSVFPIDDAVAAFTQSLQFDGILRLSKLTDAIQAAEGVTDVKITSAWHKPAGGSYSEVTMSVVPVSGHFVIDVSNSTYTYIDNVNVGITTD